jgi:hypothetical protein
VAEFAWPAAAEMNLRMATRHEHLHTRWLPMGVW